MRLGPTLIGALLLISAIPAQAQNPLGPGYHDHLPIIIIGNAGLGVGCVPNVANGVVSGCGTAANPYVVEGWRIVADGIASNVTRVDGILVRDTTAHVVIRDNYLAGHLVGAEIRVSNAQNVRVEGNVIPQSHSDGIRIENSRAVSVVSNLVDRVPSGIVITDGSGPVEVRTNTVTNTTDAILLLFSSDIRVRGNTIIGTSQNGVTVGSANVNVSENTVKGAISAGIIFHGPYSNVSITHNLVTDNSGIGIYLAGTSGSATDNIVTNNSGGGIDAKVNGAFWTISGNNIVGNSPWGACACSTTVIDFRNNWWGDSSGPSGVGLGSGDSLFKPGSAATPLWDPWLTSANPSAGP